MDNHYSFCLLSKRCSAIAIESTPEASIAEMMVMAGITSIDRNTIVMLLSGDNGVID
jgi:hypothetical protein